MNYKDWYMYILLCNDQSFYVGITNNLEERINKHNQGKGAKYTRGRRPTKLVYCEKFNNKSEARKREIQIKGWCREKKINLIKYGSPKIDA